MELAISYKRSSHPSQGKGRSETRQTDVTEAYCLRNTTFLSTRTLIAVLAPFTARTPIGVI